MEEKEGIINRRKYKCVVIDRRMRGNKDKEEIKNKRINYKRCGRSFSEIEGEGEIIKEEERI